MDKLMKYGTDKYGLEYEGWVIFGARGITTENNDDISSNNDDINEYNDALYLIRSVGGKPEYKSYVCTIDPGLYWLQHPMNVNGTARIAQGIYKYKVGIHRGHQALTQYSKVTVNRYEPHSSDKPWFQWKDEPIAGKQTDFLAVDIHAKSSTSKFVDKASAGCTVINSTWTDPPWKDFFSTVETYLATEHKPYICYCVLDQDTAISLIQS